MSERIPFLSPDTDLNPAPETTRIRQLAEDDTQVFEIDCVYSTCLLSELEFDPESDDPELVEVIGLNAPRPRT